jgi:hypothetical protein
MGSKSEPEDVMPTILVEVRGGAVQHVEAVGSLPCTIRVLIRDHDIIQDELVGQEEEWLLEP